ncbi:hypothetical protein ACFJGV_17820 [Cnuibacter sp. UC19_7]|uniref:antitoxin VbhA family protein n=1 Tax=Cnuibacter sp. UC19_7 TaxID=3350166 RepID=UPI00366FCE32
MSITTLTSAQRAERERQVAEAIHAGEMEGLPTSAETKADTDDYVAGEIDLGELEARVRARYGIA